MFIDAEDKECVAMFEYMCETNPHVEPYMLELVIWAYKYKHDEYEAIMEKYKDTEEYINLDTLKVAGDHVSAHIPEDPGNLPSKDGEVGAYNRYIQMMQRKEEDLNPEFDTEYQIVN